MDRNAPPDRRLRLSLRQLEAFCAVAMTGGVSSAARRLARTQSAVSTALGELESALGTALFERAGRGLRATDAARRLLPRALEVVERAIDLPAVAAGTPGESERLRIGASRTIGPFVMPALLARFAAERPRATVELTVANTAELLERLRHFELELAFVEGDVVAPGLLLSEWTRDTLCLFARADHPIALRWSARAAARSPRAYVEALAGAGWALREPGSGSGETFMRAIAPAIGAPRVGLTVDDPLALRRLVAAGDWLGCLSHRAIEDGLADGTLAALPAPGAEVARALARRFWIARLPERYRSDAVDAMIALAGAAPGAASGVKAARRSVVSRPPAVPRTAPRPRSRR